MKGRTYTKEEREALIKQRVVNEQRGPNRQLAPGEKGEEVIFEPDTKRQTGPASRPIMGT